MDEDKKTIKPVSETPHAVEQVPSFDTSSIYPTPKPEFNYSKINNNTIGQSVLSSKVLPEPKSNTPKIIIIVTAVVAAIAVMAAVYLFLIRVADTEYQKTITSIDAMIATADQLNSDSKTLSPFPTSKDNAVVIKKQVTDFDARLQEFKKSSAYQRDQQVKVTYESSQGKIDKYATQAKLIVTAYDVVIALSETCGDNSEAFADQALTTDARYDKAFEKCVTSLTNQKTVQPNELNDLFYSRYRQVMLDKIAVTKEYLKSDPTSRAKSEQINAKLTDILNAEKNAQDAVRFSHYDSPVASLVSIRSILIERKAVLLR